MEAYNDEPSPYAKLNPPESELSPSSDAIRSGSSQSKRSPHRYYKVEERTQIWKQRMDERLRLVRDTRKDRELEGCTFQPKLVAGGVSGGGMLGGSKKSYDRYLEKKRSIKIEREIQAKEAAMKPGYGNVWKNQITVPKPPSFTSLEKEEEKKARRKVRR